MGPGSVKGTWAPKAQKQILSGKPNRYAQARYDQKTKRTGLANRLAMLRKGKASKKRRKKVRSKIKASRYETRRLMGDARVKRGEGR